MFDSVISLFCRSLNIRTNHRDRVDPALALIEQRETWTGGGRRWILRYATIEVSTAGGGD